MTSFKGIKEKYFSSIKEKSKSFDTNKKIELAMNKITYVTRAVGIDKKETRSVEVLSKYLKGDLGKKDLKREANFLIRKSKKEINEKYYICWAMIYALLIYKKNDNFVYMLVFLISALGNETEQNKKAIEEILNF